MEWNYALTSEERNSVLDVLKGDKPFSHEQREKLEKEFCEYVGAKFAVGVGSGTAGLHCALMALGVSRYDEVITAANTHRSPPMSIMNVGAKPVLVDVDDTFNINPNKIQEKITEKTKAVLPIHAHGHPYDVEVVNEIARKNNLRIVENATQSLGAKYNGRSVGLFGDIGVFSFNGGKHIHGGGSGGMVVTNDEQLADAVRGLARQGKDSHYQDYDKDGVKADIASSVGYSYWLREINAAVASVQLRKFRKGIIGVEKRRKIAKKYDQVLKDIPEIKTPKEKDQAYHSYLRYVVRAKDRNKLFVALSKKGIHVAIQYRTPVNIEPYYTNQFGSNNGSFPVTQQTADEIVTLPGWPLLKENQQNYVVECIRKFYRS